MPVYLRAISIDDIKRFPAFRAVALSHEIEDGIVYLNEAFDVLDGPFPDSRVIFRTQDAAWRDFCLNDLAFEVPDWEMESELIRAEVSSSGQA